MIKIFNHYFDRRTVFQLLLDVSLVAGVFLGALIALSEPADLNPTQISQGLVRGLIMGVGFLAINSALGFYDRHSSLSTRQAIARSLVSFCLTTLFVVGVLLLMPLQAFYGRTWSVVLIMMVTAGLLIYQVVAGEFLPKSVAKRRVLVFGTGERAHAVGKCLSRRGANAELCGYLAGPNEREQVVPNEAILPPAPRLADVVAAKRVDEIVVALSERRGGSMPMRELLDCKLSGVRVTDIATFYEQNVGQIRLDAVSAGWLIFGEGFNQGVIRSSIKRLFDLLGALVLLLVSLPVMLVTAIIIKLESPGPIFYRQERVGLNGKPFDVVKFRSMRTDAEKDGVPRWATAGDSRVTRVGKVIRKLRIDELPQIWSVLRGDMSLVGPRPERAFFVEKLVQEIPFYAVRHSVKPGVTGWAQVRFQYGATVEDTAEKLQYDLYYVKNHSLFLDLVVLFETVGVVLTGKGAQ
ncbi:MAG: TIGR03013 family PEP-CTERM/XrtA system glycosyltransferase [Hydrogenophaga sp.]|uniref:TIGR03013 family PEP-CTERM/XrtA system glycosyltransferase n=1 Tax=Hydrogenophaga crocea TaxID=2716225 RepID=A0A6G8IFL8_9BURK|nr:MULTISPECIES: TIGR03013 family XrtA/PEP-CTERM system glycosyltransferase [Hydrogenophaga]MBL0946461.1 TIGR03013 family PEP-CTERM/XrtA system glycosyltransferase [Hydrogenophaga sp.]QIM51909.1 TIGR03013 family PEP-CTERM/XrtA system glycosyltransferase [Hydrogenophaga crocea]